MMLFTCIENIRDALCYTSQTYTHEQAAVYSMQVVKVLMDDLQVLCLYMALLTGGGGKSEKRIKYV